MDFVSQLATDPAKDKLEKWIAGMDSAMGVAEHVASGSHQVVRTQYCVGSCLLCMWLGLGYKAS